MFGLPGRGRDWGGGWTVGGYTNLFLFSQFFLYISFPIVYEDDLLCLLYIFLLCFPGLFVKNSGK